MRLLVLTLAFLVWPTGAIAWSAQHSGPDAYGCDSDGGSRWCETLQQCIRPWLKACPEETTNMFPEERWDRFGCDSARGYQYCPQTGQCYRPWEKACSASDSQPDPGYSFKKTGKGVKRFRIR